MNRIGATMFLVAYASGCSGTSPAPLADAQRHADEPPRAALVACVFETAVATTIVLTHSINQCNEPRSPEAVAVSFWQTAKRVGGDGYARSFRAPDQMIAPPGAARNVSGTIGYRIDSWGSKTGRVSFDLQVDGHQRRGEAKIVAYAAGD